MIAIFPNQTTEAKKRPHRPHRRPRCRFRRKSRYHAHQPRSARRGRCAEFFGHYHLPL